MWRSRLQAELDRAHMHEVTKIHADYERSLEKQRKANVKDQRRTDAAHAKQVCGGRACGRMTLSSFLNRRCGGLLQVRKLNKRIQKLAMQKLGEDKGWLFEKMKEDHAVSLKAKEMALEEVLEEQKKHYEVCW